MKKTALLILALALFLAVALAVRELFAIDPLMTVPEVLDDVIGAHYGENNIAKNVWDMEILDGRLYVSTGDYEKNSGRTPLFVYDIATDTWDATYITNDEALGDMRVIGDTLFIAGNDSCGEWDNANYYTVADGGIEMHAALPNGAHCFDTCIYNDVLYFGIGTATNTASPVIAYDGEGYTAVPFFKDGESLFSDAARAYLRAYNFFSLGSELYVFVYSEMANGSAAEYEIYKLCDEGFELYGNLRGKGIGFYIREERRLYQNIFKTMTVADVALIATGRLFLTSDLITYEEITPEGRVVSDVYLYGERIFVVSFSEEEEGAFTNTVSELVDGEFVDILRFVTLRSYALSLAYDGESFYIGTGGIGDEAMPGAVLKIENNLNI